MDQKPTVGRIVHYRLTDTDAQLIANQRRNLYGSLMSVGNAARLDDVYPAIIVRVFDPNSTAVSLQVHLDGPDTYWATSRTEGLDPGQWSWPARV